MCDLSEIRQQVSGLLYHNKEGGRYAYVKLLSVTRGLETALPDAADRLLIKKVRQGLNDCLCDRFSPAEENLFETARQQILSAMPAHLEA